MSTTIDFVGGLDLELNEKIMTNNPLHLKVGARHNKLYTGKTIRREAALFSILVRPPSPVNAAPQAVWLSWRWQALKAVPWAAAPSA